MKDMVCKECGDKFGKPTNEKCMYDSKDPNGKNWMESKSVKESTVFMIPEEIPATERTAFHGAAAAAHKAGKKSFSFAGKTHPVTMKKSTADAIADQKEGYYKNREIEKQDKAMGAKPEPKKKINASKSTDKEGDVSMNPKMDSEKKTEQKESRIRSALKSVLSEKKSDREEHYKSATAPEKMSDKIKGKGAKDMMAAADAEIAKGPDAHLNEPEIDKKNFEKMTSNVKVAAKRKGDNPKGDTKIVAPGTPMKDPAAMKAESVSFAQSIQNMKNVYSEMNTQKVEKEIKNERS